MYTATSRRVLMAGLSRDAPWRTWAAPTAREGSSLPHTRPPSSTSEHKTHSRPFMDTCVTILMCSLYIRIYIICFVTIPFSQELSSYSLRPTISTSLGEGSQPTRSSAEPPATQKKRRWRRGGEEDSLSVLPYEVLCHVASFLDSMSLSQLALVSRLMREVCSSLLQERGMVTLHWEKKTYSHGRAKWRVKHRVS